MAMNSISATARNAMCDALVDLLDSGTINFYTSGETTLLATCTFGSTAFGSAVDGVATANSISDDTSAANSGTVAVAVIRDSSSNDVFKGNCGDSGSYDFEFNDTSIGAGDTVSVTSMTVTMPEN